MTKIAIRAEGGAGDVLLFHRFYPAIKEKYPDSEITLYIDSEGKTFQKELIEHLYPKWYKEIKVIPNKKYKQFYIESQYGIENQIGFIENVPDEILKEIQSYDVWYDGHIDSLKWINYDFNWPKYFNLVPTPKITPILNFKNYVCLHLQSETSTTHRLDDWYIHRLINDLNKVLEPRDIRIVLISTEKTNKIYSAFENHKNVRLFNSYIQEVCNLILNSNGFIGVDSAFRLLGHSINIPTITLSKDCQGYGQVPVSHQLRWLCWPKTTFGLHYNTTEIIDLFTKMLDNKIYQVFPELKWAQMPLDNAIIKRDYKVNTEKTSLL